MGAQPVEHETLHGPAYEWPLWSTTVRVVTADPHALPSARRLVDAELARVELAASQSRRDSEVNSLPVGRPVRISPTLTAILASALEAARTSDGAVDPVVARPLASVGSDRGWQDIELDQRTHTATVPRGVRLDLTRVSRAWAADRCAAVVADLLEVGVLVSLGGDIATAGPLGQGAWEVLVQDQVDEPGALVAVPTGLAVATGSAADPVTAMERSATVVAPDCVTAATWAEAALAQGAAGPRLLEERGLPARLVGPDGTHTYVGGWPPDAEL